MIIMPNLTCGCGHVVTLTDHQRSVATKMTCPKCGVTRKLKPVEKAVDAPETTILSVSKKRPSWWRRMPVVKKGMLLATGLWPLFGAFLSHASAKGSFNRLRFAGDGYVFKGGTPTPVDEAWSQCVSQGVIIGVFAATLIYFGLMFVLLVVWFCTKPSARDE